MQKALMLLALAVTALAVTTATAGAGMQSVTFEVHEDFYAPSTSELCGVETWIRFEGTVSLKVFADAEGTIVRELDTQPGFSTTFYSPETGKWFSFPEAIVWHFEYPGGAAAGSDAKVAATGMHGRGGHVTDAGRVLFEGVVVAVDVIDGVAVPLVDFWPTGATGNFYDEDTYLSGRCEALGGSYTP